MSSDQFAEIISAIEQEMPNANVQISKQSDFSD